MPAFDRLPEDIQSLPEEARQLVIDFVAVLKERYRTSPATTPRPLNWEDEPFAGMWHDRPEMNDSTAWVREVRQKHWRS